MRSTVLNRIPEESKMPHVIIKMYPGRTAEQKKRLVESITDSFIRVANVSDASLSVDIVEIAPEEWPDKVYRHDILDRYDSLYKKPGYNPFSDKKS
jgi:4-oxalocrotonate tautomerase